MLRIGRISSDGLTAVLEAARGADPSYPEVGATAGSHLPSGYRHDRYEERVAAPTEFGRAVEGLRSWAAHKGAGAVVVPDDPVTLGATVLVVLGVGPLQMIAPCRIVGVTDTDQAFGFTYGTLPGHPEQGEEAFLVELRPDGAFFTIVAFSRPADPLARLAGPLGRAVQRTVTRRYLSALAKHSRAAR